MIIVRLAGGLGNQMFQYAFGRNLALKSGAHVVFDVSSYAHQKPEDAQRFYSLDALRTRVSIATDDDFKKIGIVHPGNLSLFARIQRMVTRWRDKKRPLMQKHFIFEGGKFDSEYANLKNAYLIGNWQSEKYFIDNAYTLRSELQPIRELSAEAHDLQKEIDSKESISIHVRRGDYVDNPQVVKKVGILPTTYYHEALTYLKNKKHIEKIFVFSDDIEWCAKNLKFDLPAIYVQGKNLEDYEEMWLMSRCKHNIIARSSFSWWGAWLNTHPGKVVIAPTQRRAIFIDSDYNFLPSSWIRI